MNSSVLCLAASAWRFIMSNMKKLIALVAQIRLMPLLEALGTAAFRVLPYALRPPNLTPMGGFALYGGARLPLWQAVFLPMSTMVVSDLLLKQIFGYPMFNPYVYASFLIYAGMGRLLLKDRKSWSRIIGVTVLGSVQFFLITNFGAWYQAIGTPWERFPATFTGLLQNYVSALPFFTYTLEGDLLFSCGFIALHEWALRRSPALASILLPQECQG